MILNIKHDLEFRKIFLKTIDQNLNYKDFTSRLDCFDKKYLIANFKISISKYIEKSLKNNSILEKRVQKSEFADFSIRFSNYLLNNLKLNEVLKTINVREYLRNKRIPLDTKSLHGNYPKNKIKKILENKGYKNIDPLLNKAGITILEHNLEDQLNEPINENNNLFCTERYINKVIKVKDNKLKKFDLIILHNNKPQYLFEINFYSTEGTKIGINQNEYIDLNNYIKDNFDNFKFYWITDGNYWLTVQGKLRFLYLLKYFDKIFNINTFTEQINNF